MRRIVWCFVVGGVLVSQMRLGYSEVSGTPAARTSGTQEAAAMSTYRRRSASEPAARPGYYSELFGDESAPPNPDSPASADAASSPAQVSTPAAETPRAGFVNFMRGSTSQAPRGAVTAAAPTAPPASSEVIHAEFEHAAEHTERSQIRQVSNNRREARAMPSSLSGALLNEPVATQASPPLPPREAAPRRNAQSTPSRRPSAAAVRPETVAGPQSPSVEVTWVKAADISVGKEFTCNLVVQNTGSVAARRVEVTATFPDNVRLLRADPQPSAAQDVLTWNWSELAVGETQSIQITMLPFASGDITTQADVRFSSAVAGRFEVSEPLLAIQIEGPRQVLIGEPATQTVLISNPGTGVAHHVEVEAVIPPGLEHARGARLLMDLGALQPGESRNVRLPLAAIAGGKHIVQVQARAETDLVQHASAEVAVIAPQVLAAVDGPSLRYLGRRATYTLRVTNDGDVATDNVRVMHKVPEGLTFVSAENGATFNESTRLLNWFAGELARGETKTVEVTLSCDRIGDFTHYIRATSEQGSVSDAHISTVVEGTPSLSMDIRDLEDPVEVGSETVYEIRLKNEGSAPAKDVRLACELPAGLTVADVSASIRHVVEGDLLVFQPITQLNPGEAVTIRVAAKASLAGNLRFRARLTSASIDEPLLEEEITKFYGE